MRVSIFSEKLPLYRNTWTRYHGLRKVPMVPLDQGRLYRYVIGNGRIVFLPGTIGTLKDPYGPFFISFGKSSVSDKISSKASKGSLGP